MSQSNALIVDASISMRHYVRNILHRELGFNEIHEANDVDEALRVMKSGHVVDWIFSALEIPGQAPLDLLRVARSGSNSTHPRFVLMSSNDEFVTRELAIRKGAADYLHKPFVPSQLVNMVHRLNGLVERRDAERFKLSQSCEINIGFDSFHHYGAELADISMTGCRMKTSQVKPGSGHTDDIATVTLLLEDGSPFHVHAKIKRVELFKFCTDPLRNTEVAIEFVDVTPPLKEKLKSFIESSRGESAVQWQN